MSLTKTIKISEETHKKLTDLGFKKETYDDIINRLIKNYDSDDHLTPEQEAKYKSMINEIKKGNRKGFKEFNDEDLDEKIRELSN